MNDMQDAARLMLAALKAVKTNNDPAWQTLDNLMTVVEDAIRRAEGTGLSADAAVIDPLLLEREG